MPSKTAALLSAAADIENPKMPLDQHNYKRFEWWGPGWSQGQPHNVVSLNQKHRAPPGRNYVYSNIEYGFFRCTLRGGTMIMQWFDDDKDHPRVRVPATAEAIAAELATIQLRDEV